MVVTLTLALTCLAPANWEVRPPAGLMGLRTADGTHRTLSLAAGLDGWVVEETSVEGLTRTSLLHEPVSGARCQLLERLEQREGVLLSEITVRGLDQACSAPIALTLSWPASGETRIWAPWGAYPGAEEVALGWSDPLVPLPLAEATLTYGGVDFSRADTISLPMVTLLEPEAGIGLTLALSPEETARDIKLETRPDGTIRFVHRNLRIAPDRTVRISARLALHAPSPRAALGWVVRQWPEWFESPEPVAREVAGCGAYSAWEGPLDSARLARMAFRMNWKASFDFPYMGMFLPPVGREERWTRFGGGETSIRQIAEYAERMRAEGFHVLSYFNVTEFGARVAYPPPTGASSSWREANDFLWGAMPSAVLPGADGKPIGTWEGAVVTDCGDPTYRAFLLEQARRHIAELPATSGICIDRMDWLAFANRTADDGVTWIDGGPARSVLGSWQSLMAELGPMMHASGKAIFANPHYRRLDAVRQVDGIYDEFGQIPASLNACSFLALRKPYVGWTPDASSLRPDPDAYLQRHLHMGAFPTAPVPGNDHTIRPDPDADAAYLDYGPLFDALTGRNWALAAEASVARGEAKANLFEVPGGWLAAVTYGGERERVTLRLRGLSGRARIESLRPGESDWLSHGTWPLEGNVSLRVPLGRGCAVVRLLSTWIEPEGDWWLGSPLPVRLGTVVPGAVVRYTLDGSLPTADSPRAGGAVVLSERTMLRCAAFVGRRQVGSVAWRELTPHPLPQPSIEPTPGIVTPGTKVRVSLPWAIPGARVEVERAGETYRARIALADGRVGPLLEASYLEPPAELPKPEVALSSLTPTRATVGWGEGPKPDLSIQGKPLSVAGMVYVRGLGTHAHSEVAYALDPSWGEFVATVGIDDEMRGWTVSTVVFEVLCDGVSLARSPVVRLGQLWRLRVPLPDGAREIVLRASDAGDGINCDHADWVDAGFLPR